MIETEFFGQPKCRLFQKSLGSNEPRHSAAWEIHSTFATELKDLSGSETDSTSVWKSGVQVTLRNWIVPKDGGPGFYRFLSTGHTKLKSSEDTLQILGTSYEIWW